MTTLRTTRIWAELSTRPRACQCAAAVCGMLVGLLAAWIGTQFPVVLPMEWPQ